MLFLLKLILDEPDDDGECDEPDQPDDDDVGDEPDDDECDGPDHH